MKTILLILLSVILLFAETTTVSDTLKTYGPQPQQTIIIQQQNNTNGYGWNTWSDAGKAWFIIGMVTLTVASIVIPIAVANSVSDSYIDTYDYY